MKNLVLAVTAIPGVDRRIVVGEAIDLAGESDCLVELRIEGTELHLLPESILEQALTTLNEKTGR